MEFLNEFPVVILRVTFDFALFTNAFICHSTETYAAKHKQHTSIILAFLIIGLRLIKTNILKNYLVIPYRSSILFTFSI